MAVRHRASLIAVAAVLLAGLAACGDDEGSPEPTLDGDTTSEATADPSGSTSAGTEPSEPASSTAAFDDEGYETHRGRIAADDPEEQAVADAWFAFWEVLGLAYYSVEVDPDAVGEVARGSAAANLIAYVDYLRKEGLHTEGDAKIGISEITIDGRDAFLRSCMENKSVDVDESGEPVEDLTRYINIFGSLRKVGDTWLVQSKDTTGEKKCKA